VRSIPFDCLTEELLSHFRAIEEEGGIRSLRGRHRYPSRSSAVNRGLGTSPKGAKTFLLRPLLWDGSSSLPSSSLSSSFPAALLNDTIRPYVPSRAHLRAGMKKAQRHPTVRARTRYRHKIPGPALGRRVRAWGTKPKPIEPLVSRTTSRCQWCRGTASLPPPSSSPPHRRRHLRYRRRRSSVE